MANLPTIRHILPKPLFFQAAIFCPGAPGELVVVKKHLADQLLIPVTGFEHPVREIERNDMFGNAVETFVDLAARLAGQVQVRRRVVNVRSIPPTQIVANLHPLGPVALCHNVRHVRVERTVKIVDEVLAVVLDRPCYVMNDCIDMPVCQETEGRQVANFAVLRHWWEVLDGLTRDDN